MHAGGELWTIALLLIFPAGELWELLSYHMFAGGELIFDSCFTHVCRGWAMRDRSSAHISPRVSWNDYLVLDSSSTHFWGLLHKSEDQTCICFCSWFCSGTVWFCSRLIYEKEPASTLVELLHEQAATHTTTKEQPLRAWQPPGVAARAAPRPRMISTATRNL